MAVLTVGMLRDLLATLDADMTVRLSMNMEYDDDASAVYVSGDSLYLDDVPTDDVGGSVLWDSRLD